MIPLVAKKIDLINFSEKKTYLVKISNNPNIPYKLKNKSCFIVKDKYIPDEFFCYICFDKNLAKSLITKGKKIILLNNEYKYLDNEDIIRINTHKRSLHVLYRKKSTTNSFLLTEQCNHYCLMCSQPPKQADDSWIIDEILTVIPMINKDAKVIGLTGGEPTLLGSNFLKIVEKFKNFLPNTSLHILSNGRNFSNINFAKDFSLINHHDAMLGIPLYSDVANIHNYVVQSNNAFDETIKGILNLKRFNQKVEIRIVVHKQTFSRLAQLSEFISRNLLFVDHVAFMGLEITGFTKANMSDLWMNPVDYKDQLNVAVNILANAGIHTSIYNHQLCVIDKSIWKFNRKSISDWKNEYIEECSSCTQLQNCGGFFTSQLIKPSPNIKALSD